MEINFVAEINELIVATLVDVGSEEINFDELYTTLVVNCGAQFSIKDLEKRSNEVRLEISIPKQ